jgi:hypothetical protein
MSQNSSAVLAESVAWQMDEEYFGTASDVRHSSEEQESKPLDEAFFPSFAPLIRACQAYAKLSGCRFSITAFDGIECDVATRIPVVSDKRAQDAGPLLSAKLRAAPMVSSFAKRIRSGEPSLLQDLTRAFHFVMKETARNSMIASCKAADFFPPTPAPSSVDDQDCAWDEVGLASAPVIAQRLYNDEVQRLHDAKTLVDAKTASFVVEFADELCVELPQLPAQRTDMLQQFQRDLASWTSASASQAPMPTKCDSDPSAELAAKLAAEHQGRLVLGATAMAMVGIVGLASHAAAHIAQKSVRAHASHRTFGTRMQF